MAKTVICKPKELMTEVGNEKAIEYFQKRIDEIGKPKNFQEVCNISGLETAIAFIENKIGQ